MIGITLGDPVGVGPEIIVKAFSNPTLFETIRPVVLGDHGVLKAALQIVKSDLVIHEITSPSEGRFTNGTIDMIPVSALNMRGVSHGNPTQKTGKAMTRTIIEGIDLALSGKIDAIVTCPINKVAMNMAGYAYNGHTELLAERTKTENYAMMLAGERLRVVLVTIHMPYTKVPETISVEKIVTLIRLTDHSLKTRFGIESPRIAVAGLNPHAGEEGMFGREEIEIIAPAVDIVKAEGMTVSGPFPPDTVYYHAAKGAFDVVVSMYHDQGLIPFKLIHFENGVNTTLGLPIIRTSVDHGTAYDIAGTGKANPESLLAAIRMAADQSLFSARLSRK